MKIRVYKYIYTEIKEAKYRERGTHHDSRFHNFLSTAHISHAETS